MDCPHPSIRNACKGACFICGLPERTLDEKSTTDEEAIEAAWAQLEAERAAAAEELARLDADAARLDLAEFVRQGWHVLESVPLEWNWHHEALCRNVQGMLEEWMRAGDDPSFVMRWQNLVLNICPISLKSRVVMVYAVAWMWLRNSTWSVLCVSANPGNVTRDAEACRDLVTSTWYRETFQVQWTIRPDIDSKAKFATTAGGERVSRGLSSKFTGVHVSCILLDDPDDAHDVHSEAARRERAGKWESIGNRVNDPRRAVRIILQQRVHVDDCTGDVLTRGGWLHANYPVLYSERLRRDSPFFTDPRTTEGENLHPSRFTPVFLAAERLRLGSQGFEGQYNGNPAPSEGNMFQRGDWRFFRIQNRPVGPAKRPQGCTAEPALVIPLDAKGRPVFDSWAITVDATFGSLSATASAVGIAVAGIKGPKRFVVEDRTKPMTFPQTKDAIRELMRDYPMVSRILVEKKANGAAIIQDLESEFSGLIPVEVEGGKTARAHAMLPAVESGNWYLLEGEPWIDEFLAEMGVFPHGKRDDRVDMCSQLAAHFREADENARHAAATSNLRDVAAMLGRY